MVPTHMNVVRTGPRGAEPVVLLHSAGLDLTYWDAQIEALSGDADVVAMDLPTHGRSGGASADATIESMSRAAAGVLDALGAGAVHLVGLSVGGLVAQTVALDRPDLVGTLSLLDTAARFSPPGQQAMRARAATAREEGVAAVLDGLLQHWILPSTRELRPHLVDRMTKTVLGHDPGAHAALWEAIAAFDCADRLRDVAVPTLVLVGDQDSSSPVSSAQELADLLPRSEMHVLDGCAHLSPLENPTAVSRHLRRFVSRHRATAAA